MRFSSGKTTLITVNVMFCYNHSEKLFWTLFCFGIKAIRCLSTYYLTVGRHFVSLQVQALKLKLKARKNPITKGTCLVYMALNKCLSVVILSGFSPLPCPRVVVCVRLLTRSFFASLSNQCFVSFSFDSNFDAL